MFLEESQQIIRSLIKTKQKKLALNLIYQWAREQKLQLSEFYVLIKECEEKETGD